jgi:hypothetical protein
MTDLIEIKDDLVSPSLFNKLKGIIEPPTFPWYWSSTTASETYNDGYSFSHLSYVDGRAVSQHNDLFHDAMLNALDKFDVKVESWYRTRLGLITNQNKELIHKSHVDQDTPHHTLLFYVIDSDGDTYMYNKDGSIAEQITPKANRGVLFLGNIKHSSSLPVINDRRIAINVNFKIKDYDYGGYFQS